MDFVGPLPVSRNGFDCLMVTVNSVSKRVHAVPSDRDIARIYCRVIWKHHGLSQKIILDRDARFMSIFWEKPHEYSTKRVFILSLTKPKGTTSLRDFCRHNQND
jgi:hypothetical protein